MSKAFSRLALVFGAVFFFSMAAFSEETSTSIPDSVFFNNSMRLYDSLLTPSFEKMYKDALRMTKEAGNERYYIITRRMLVSKHSLEKNVKAFIAESDKVIKECKESESEVANKLIYEVYNFKADRLDMWGRKKEALETAQEMAEYAQENHHMKGLAMSQYFFGGFYLNSHQLEEADRCLKKAWDICEEEGLKELQVRVGFSRLGVKIDTKEYEEGLEIAGRVRELISQREAAGAHIAPVTRLKLAQRLSSLNCCLGNTEAAELQRDTMFQWFNVSNDPSQLRAVLHTDATCKLQAKKFDEACPVLDSLIRIARRNNNWEEIANDTYSLAWAQTEMGNTEEAVANFKLFAEAKDSAAVQDCRAQLDELSQKYEVSELKWNARRLRYRLSLLLAVVILLLLVIGFDFFYTKHLLEKNKALYEKVRRFDEREEIQTEAMVATTDSESPLAAIFKKVTTVLKEEKLFVDPSLNRDSLATAVGTNSKYLADAVREYSEGKTVNDLINWWRLHEASNLLRESPSMQVVEVGEEAGFGSSQTFYRLFKDHFGMTPNEYRKVVSTLAS